jgi:hypothetical protein
MKKQLQAIMHLTPAQVEDAFYCGQISYQLYRAYELVWGWSAPRWSNPWSDRQERFWEKYGKDAFYRKINKTRAAFGFSLIPV